MIVWCLHLVSAPLLCHALGFTTALPRCTYQGGWRHPSSPFGYSRTPLALSPPWVRGLHGCITLHVLLARCLHCISLCCAFGSCVRFALLFGSMGCRQCRLLAPMVASPCTSCEHAACIVHRCAVPWKLCTFASSSWSIGCHWHRSATPPPNSGLREHEHRAVLGTCIGWASSLFWPHVSMAYTVMLASPFCF